MNDQKMTDAGQPDLVDAWYLWAVVRRINAARYPRPIDTLLAVFGEGRKPLLPTDEELHRCGIDLCVLDRELSHGLDPALFNRALRAGVLNVDAFNNSPFHRENRAEFYDAMLAMVERVERKLARPERRTLREAIDRHNARVEKQERNAINRSLSFLGEAI